VPHPTALLFFACLHLGKSAQLTESRYRHHGCDKKRIAAAGIKNASIVVIPPPPIRGIGQAAGFSMQIEQGNTNDDVYAFENVVKKFVAEAHKNPAIATAFSYYGAHTPSYDLTLDREKCEKMGVNISDVFTTMQAYMGSLFVNNLTLYNRTFHVLFRQIQHSVR